jgi:beta-mannosidase
LYRYNDIKFRWVAYEPNWIFTKYFHIDETLLRNSLIFIQFNSIDTISKIYLNNEIILSTQNQFIKYSTDFINSYLFKEVNKLEIQFESPVLYAKSQAKQYPYHVPVEYSTKLLKRHKFNH